MRHIENTNFERSGDAQPRMPPYSRNADGCCSNGRAIRSALQGRRDIAPFEIGGLSEDPAVLAARIAHACAYGTMTVWIDDGCRVQCAKTNALSSAQSLPLHWVMGIYTCGVSLEDVIDDLRHERTQRERVWVLA